MNIKNNMLKLNGVIIGDSDYKEYDKLLTILTKELGKIYVYSFNVRRSSSKNIGKTNLFTFATFEVRKNQDKYFLENVILAYDFNDLANSFDNICYASYFIELASFVTFENLICDEIIDLLYYSFKALKKGIIDKKLIRRIYELKIIKYLGEYKISDDLNDDNTTLKYTWDFVILSEPKKLFTFKLSKEIFDKFDYLVNKEMKEKIGKNFTSLELINNEIS